MDENVKKLFCILNNLNSEYAVSLIVSNFANHFGDLNDDDFEEVRKFMIMKRAENIARYGSTDNRIVPLMLDYKKFPLPRLISDDKSVFSDAFQESYEKVAN